jgi:uncharacterized protein YktB (UPF0637 family)
MEKPESIQYADIFVEVLTRVEKIPECRDIPKDELAEKMYEIIETDDEFLSDLFKALDEVEDGTRTVDEVAREVCRAVKRFNRVR